MTMMKRKKTLSVMTARMIMTTLKTRMWNRKNSKIQKKETRKNPTMTVVLK
jgi:hypothetical protein